MSAIRWRNSSRMSAANEVPRPQRVPQRVLPPAAVGGCPPRGTRPLPNAMATAVGGPWRWLCPSRSGTQPQQTVSGARDAPPLGGLPRRGGGSWGRGCGDAGMRKVSTTLRRRLVRNAGYGKKVSTGSSISRAAAAMTRSAVAIPSTLMSRAMARCSASSVRKGT